MPLTHTPSLPILLYISLLAPFIAWDSAYVFLRPHSFPSGKYASYFTHMVDGAEVDRLYSQAAWRAGDDGVIVAQAVLSMVEVGLYLAYVGMVLWRVGLGGLIKRRMLRGEEGKWVVLVGFAAGVLGGTKTAQYFSREVASGFKYTGHNEPHPLVMGWGIFIYIYFSMCSAVVVKFGRDILRGLSDRDIVVDHKDT